jgi:hypothetical protein
MRMSDEEYFRSCVAQERHLAYLLGHHNIEECYESAGTLWENTQALPQWTPHYESEAGQVHSSSVTIGKIVVHFSDHPTRDQAVRYAIVKAVIFLLEHPKAGKFK